jgi:hypothetical protein
MSVVGFASAYRKRLRLRGLIAEPVNVSWLVHVPAHGAYIRAPMS